VIGIPVFRRRPATTLTLVQAHRGENFYAWAAIAFTVVLSAIRYGLSRLVTRRPYPDGWLDHGADRWVVGANLAFLICATLSTMALATLIICMLVTKDLLLQSMAPSL